MPDTSVNSRPGVCVKHAFSFRKVFSDKCGQKEVFDEVAIPLLEKLIRGGNGLLLTYGVTGSGKTYTMTGVRNNLGIMPRCVDVLFNSIGDYQADEFVFKSDRMNLFDVQTKAAAAKDYEESLKKIRKGGRIRKYEQLIMD